VKPDDLIFVAQCKHNVAWRLLMIRQVKVVTHQPQWRNAFKIESHSVSQAFGGNVSAIHHIGSTAILNIYAKPIIDLLIIDRCTKFREIDAIQLLSS
jgi:GrpB-like predicted nucleotidyltransferase (UPF0157 family)